MKTNAKQTDRRVIRTKKEILNALTELLEQKAIEEITVKEITDLAGINRGTFYLHYIDKFDLFEKSVNQLLLEFRKMGTFIISKASTKDSGEQKEEIIQKITSVFEYVKENHRFVKALTSKNSSYSFHHKFNEILKDHLVGLFESIDGSVPAVYLATALSYAYQGLIQTWIQNDMQESSREMSEYAYQLFHHFETSMFNGQDN